MHAIFRIAAAMALFAAQDDPTKRARELVEKLSSDQVELRDEAVRKLKELGKAAIPELEKAAQGREGEAAARARMILRVFEIRGQLTPTLLRTKPGVEDTKPS